MTEHGEPFHSDSDGLPLTQVQLDEIQCAAPLCEECGKHRVPMMMYAKCCESTAVEVTYCIGMIRVACAGCGSDVAQIAVDPGRAPETP